MNLKIRNLQKLCAKKLKNIKKVLKKQLFFRKGVNMEQKLTKTIHMDM